ncbi:MAG: hypothetical protein KF823_09880 [Xanthomonadales bacterium]|nr:hypothetical protein [Xanthomonadales bacterium]
MPLIALATAVPALPLDEDLPPLLAALERAGWDAQVRAWDDATVSWARFDLVLLRSTWDYTGRLPGFLAWCDAVAARTRLLNAPEVVRWNTDKRYLGVLADAGAPVVPSHFLAPDEDAGTLPGWPEFVVKPTVGAGSRGARRFLASEREQAVDHARQLQAQGLHVLVQPYLDQVDEAGETALLYFDGEFSHAIRKGPLLKRQAGSTRALFAPEHIRERTPSAQERSVAEQVLAAQPFGRLPYARVDLLPSPEGPRLLELELTEPSLFLDHAPGSADRLVDALQRCL